MEKTVSEIKTSNLVKAPWHLWVIGIAGLLWSAMGAMDYLMTMTRNEEYMAAFTPEQLEFFYGFPVWVDAAWAIAVWGGVLGTILLLLRMGLSVWVLLVSFLAMAVTAFHNYVLSNGMEVVGDTFSLVFTAIIFLVGLGLYLYAKKMYSNGVLK